MVVVVGTYLFAVGLFDYYFEDSEVLVVTSLMVGSLVVEVLVELVEKGFGSILIPVDLWVTGCLRWPVWSG